MCILSHQKVLSLKNFFVITISFRWMCSTIIYWWDIKESTIFFVISFYLCETSRRNFSTISKITHNLQCRKLREKKAWVFVYISSNCTVWNQLKLIMRNIVDDQRDNFSVVTAFLRQQQNEEKKKSKNHIQNNSMAITRKCPMTCD